MDQDIQTHLKMYQKCQLQRTRDQTKPALLSTLPQCTQPNQRIHADLFGFLVVSGRGKKYILCITDVFTKYVELVAIDNKEAATLAEAFLRNGFVEMAYRWKSSPTEERNFAPSFRRSHQMYGSYASEDSSIPSAMQQSS